MNESLTSKLVGCDLWQNRYFISCADGDLSDRPSFHTNTLDLMPSALLPLYPGEKGFYGFDALQNRRCRGLSWPNECRLYWNDDNIRGCGRVPLIAAMRRSIDFHRSWGLQEENNRTSDFFSWKPNERELCLRGPEIICNTLKKIAPEAEDVALTLADVCDEGVQQAILSAHTRAFNSTYQLHFLRRSIAQAMCWCCDNQDKLAKVVAPYHGQYAGHLLVINMSMDIWEARLVPLQWQWHGGNNYLVPVDSERWPRTSLKITGWEVAQRWLSYQHSTDHPDTLWNLLLGSDALKDVLNMEKMESTLWSRLNHCHVPLLPHCDGLYSLGMPSLIDLEQNLLDLAKKKEKFEGRANHRLGVILDGSFIGSLDFKRLFPSLSHLVGKENSFYQASDRSSLAAAGAALYLQYLKNGLPTYLQEIIPVGIWCRNTARLGSEFFWKPLIEKETLEAGKACSVRRCPDFVLPVGCRSLQLTLCRPLHENENFEYRTIEAIIHEQFVNNVDVSIEVSVKPGAGYAKAQIITETGHLLSQLDWAAMRPCQKPAEHNPGYLAKVCEAFSDETKWNPIAKIAMKLQLEKLLGKTTTTERLNKVLVSVAGVIKKDRITQDKHDMYCEWRAVSSEGTVTIYSEQLPVIATFLEVCYQRAERIEDGEMSKLSLQAMRHFFTAIPETCKKLWRTRLDKRELLNMYQLLCIGNSFANADEIDSYLRAFCHVMRHSDGRELYWLQALGSILRYRNIALDPQIINDELFHDVWHAIELKLKDVTLGTLQPKKALSAIRCLNYLLGRRRFDKSFMTPNSEANEKLTDHLLYVKTLNIKSKQLPILIEQLLKLLACNASEADIQLLLSSEINIPDE